MTDTLSPESGLERSDAAGYFTLGEPIRDAKAPSGSIGEKWTKRKFEARLVNPANRRKLTISPTEQGTELFARAIADRRALYHDLLEDIDDADRAVVERALRRMVERIRELDPEQ